MAIVSAFTYCITSGSVDDPSGYTVDFTNASTGGANGRIWSFGDGTTSGFPSPTHTYISAGPHIVTLRSFTHSGWTVRTNANGSIEKKEAGGTQNTPALAFSAFSAASWGANDASFTPRFTLKNIPKYAYQAARRTINCDLTADGSKDIAILQMPFDLLADSPGFMHMIASEGGLKTDTGLQIRPRFDELKAVGPANWLIFGDVSSSLGTAFSLDLSDIDDYLVPHTVDPGVPEATGYQSGLNDSLGTGRIRVANITDEDTSVQVIENIVADFKANGSSVPVSGTNIFNVLFTDTTTKTPTSHQYYKRKANTEIIVPSTNPEQVNAPGTLPDSIFTTHPNISAVTVKDTTQTTTYVLGVDYNITFPAATGEIEILDSAGITPGELLKLEYTSVDPWVLISTDQNPNVQFDKENP